jgi:hypothetical protein
MEEPCPFDALPSGGLMRISPPIALKQKKSKSVILTMRLDSGRSALTGMPLLWTSALLYRACPRSIPYHS